MPPGAKGMGLLAMVGPPKGGMPKLKKTEKKEDESPREEESQVVDFRANLKKSAPPGGVKLPMPVLPKKA